jgi:hypothetical protein
LCGAICLLLCTARIGSAVLRQVAIGAFALIRIDAYWMATEPLDMHEGSETAEREVKTQL